MLINRLGECALNLVRDIASPFGGLLRVMHIRCIVLADGLNFGLSCNMKVIRFLSSLEYPEVTLLYCPLVTFLYSSSTDSL